MMQQRFSQNPPIVYIFRLEYANFLGSGLALFLLNVYISTRETAIYCYYSLARPGRYSRRA